MAIAQPSFKSTISFESVFISLTGCLLPIKLTLGYIGLIPLLLWWLAHSYKDIPNQINKSPSSLKILCAFFTVCAGASFFGIDINNSVQHFGTLFFFPLTILCFADYTPKYERLIISSLMVGAVISSSIAAVHFAFPEASFFQIGAVSQSGQFTMLFFISIYAMVRFPKQVAMFLASFLLISLILILNLKRGPWMGTSVAVLLFLAYLQNRRAILLFLLTVIIAAAWIPPISDRLASSLSHFFIAGGRSEIWSIGTEFISKYPLGIGFDNSGILRDYSAEIPKNLKHFHSNYLNIFVEIGYLGIAVFLSFLYTLGLEVKRAVDSATTQNQKITIMLLGCAFIAWSIAGLVEYNFGDSAVVSVFYIVLGVCYSRVTTVPA